MIDNKTNYIRFGIVGGGKLQLLHKTFLNCEALIYVDDGLLVVFEPQVDTAYVVIAVPYFPFIIKLLKYLCSIMVVKQRSVVIASNQGNPCYFNCLCKITKSIIKVVDFIAAFLKVFKFIDLCCVILFSQCVVIFKRNVVKV